MSDPISIRRAFAGKHVLLTGASWGASYLPLGRVEMPVALVIAAVKATLVALFFMQLWRSRFVYQLTIVIGLIMIGIMLAFTTLDVVTRG